MSRRDLVLEEMGIAPRWRLRAPAAETDGPPRERETAATEGDLAPAALTEASGMQPAAAAPAPARRAAPAGDPSPEAAAPAASRPARPSNAVKARKAPPIPSPADGEEARGRRQDILQMGWDALRASVAQCTACPLQQQRTQAVFGVGDEHAEWLFVGEGPGADEDALGEPFVGQAGKLLDSMLAAIGLERGRNVYIANVVKCRPPGNRTPQEREMACCEPYLARQIELIRPKLIVALGKTSASHLLQTDEPIARLRGRVHRFRGTPLIVTYHPAYLLRTLQDKSKSWADLCFARETMQALSEAEDARA